MLKIEKSAHGELILIVALFEDENYRNFLPLTYTRPVFMLRSGMFTTLERTQKMFSHTRVVLFSRDYLAPMLKCQFKHQVNAADKIDEEFLIVNGALMLNKQVDQLIEKKLKLNTAVSVNGRIALARLSEKFAKNNSDVLLEPLTSAKSKRILKECRILKGNNLPLMNYPWDLVDNCSMMIMNDCTLLHEKEATGTIDERAVIYGEKSSVHVDKGAFIEAGVVLDARKGPIYVGRNSVVQSGSRITGPAHIGDETIISSALILEGCSIGNVCRIGGEIEKTIVHGYSNKHHLGYLGHAYIGEWVNVGANTTNSNLKTTYGTVNVNVNGKRVDTKKTLVGCFIGDHVKTSIGTQIYTGKKIGVASHVHGFITEDVPSFTVWAKSLGAGPVELYLESVIETEKRVFARRGVKQTKEDVDLLKKLFSLTSQERREARVVKKRLEL